MKKSLLCIIFILSMQNLFSSADLFESHKSNFLNMFNDTIDKGISLLDFDGDTFWDVLNDDFEICVNPANEENPVSGFSTRYAVKLDSKYISSDLKYTILPSVSTSEIRDSIILYTEGNQFKIMRYINDRDYRLKERYTLFPFLLGKVRNVSQILVGNVMDSDSVDLLAIAYAANFVRLYVYDDQLSHFSTELTTLSAGTILSLPEFPSFFDLCFLNDDQRKDIFFEFSGEWSLWLTYPGSSWYSSWIQPDSYIIPIPAGVKKAVSLLAGSDDYPAFVSVESDADSDIAYMIFPKDQLDQPIPVSIPNKHAQGSISHLFSYTNQNTGESFLLLFVYNRQNQDDPQANTFYLYKIDPNFPLQPQFIQTYIPEYSVAGEEYRYFFDHPEWVSDFNNDRVPDLVMACMGVPSDSTSDNSAHFLSMGYLGINPTSSIPDWSIYE